MNTKEANVFKGVIIEESLEDTVVLKRIKIVQTRIEKMTLKHKTPWVNQWTLHTVEIPLKDAKMIAEELSRVIDISHESSWYADFKNELQHYIIFRNKVFLIDRRNKDQYEEASKYGISLGIPPYQVNFAANLVE
ncbi:MAG: hypothetical protein ACP5N2_01115 [Candidatus Nanoarchaeia archaeon]